MNDMIYFAMADIKQDLSYQAQNLTDLLTYKGLL